MLKNWFIYHIVSGQAFFAGAALVFVGWLLSWRVRSARVGHLRRLSIVFGLLLMGLSGTPLSLVSLVLLAGSLAAWLLIDGHQVAPERRRVVFMSRCAFLLIFAVCVINELRYHLPPNLANFGDQPICVIGDSMSAEFDASTPWPAVWAKRSGRRIKNVAVAGADAKSAMRQCREIDDQSNVIVEIGGNDILGDASADDFERSLDALLRELTQKPRKIAMFEIPLPPWSHRFGAIQRRLANRYGVRLIPKRVLLGAVTAEQATSDGLHLSQQGHNLLAAQMLRFFDEQTY